MYYSGQFPGTARMIYVRNVTRDMVWVYSNSLPYPAANSYAKRHFGWVREFQSDRPVTRAASRQDTQSTPPVPAVAPAPSNAQETQSSRPVTRAASRRIVLNL